MLDWCSRNFDARFQFVHSTHGSKSYNQAGTSGKYRLPLGDSSVDFVFSASLFTHLLEPELLNYCEEAFRTLKAGGRMFMHCFCLDHAERTRGGRHTFKHLIGNSHVESLSVPEAAVAYTEAFLLDTAAHVGFRNFRIIAQKDDAWFQPVLLAEK
jgi:SAM-dependent methyltransferase